MAVEIWKSVEIEGEKYSIKKFDAMTGLTIAKSLIAKLSPALTMIKAEETTEEDIASLLSVLANIEDKDLTQLIAKCLKHCYKLLPAGPQAVMDKMGNYCIDDLEYDMVKTIRLCVEAIKWGASDFFGERGSALAAELVAALG